MSAPLDWGIAWSARHFAAFFQAVHGYAPFPWQSRLAERLLAGERWPVLAAVKICA